MVRGGKWLDEKRLREVRLALGVSQRELARRAGISEPSVSMFERGLTQPEPPTLAALAKALGVTPADLLLPLDGPPSLLRRRVEAGLIQREVADQLGIPPSTYAAIERGESELPDALRARLDRILVTRARRPG